MLIISAGITLGLLPFAVLRIMQADWEIALMNTSVVLGTFILFLHLLITKNALVARTGLSVLTIFAMTMTIHFKGVDNIHWVYPALTTTFFLLSPPIAALLTSVFLCVVIIMVWDQVGFIFILTFSISAGATFLFSFAFSRRMHTQALFLEHLATTDSLTGVGNRRRLEEKLLDITRRIKRYPEQCCSLIIFDIDYFKQVNDTYGHACGDQVLQKFTDIMTNNIRDVDSFYRLGGEEFVLVLENTNLFEARKLANKLALAIENSRWHINDLKLTTSAGIAQFNVTETTYDWLKRADKALYHAKSSGRNQCLINNEFSTASAEL